MINKNISDELKIYELSLIWKEAEYNFAFWEKFNGTLDWDKAYREALPRVLATDNLYDYYMELKRFLALLRDGHTNVYFPKSLLDNLARLPINLEYIEGKHVITQADKSLDIKQFSIINKINGVDIHEYIKENILPYICEHEKYDSAYPAIREFFRHGKENEEVDLEISEGDVNRNIKIKRIKGNVDWVSYFKEPEPPEKYEILYNSDSHIIAKTSDNIGYIRIDTFSNNKLGEEFYSNQKILENMRGFIIDVRYNGGGNSNNADNVAKAFIDGEFQTSRDLKPIHIGTYKAWGKSQNFGNKSWDEVVAERGYSEWLEKCYKIPKRTYYEESRFSVNHDGCPFLLKQPLVVLSSCNTGSAAEDFLVVLDQANRATIIGSASFGSTGQPLLYELESGGGVRICTRNCTYPDGREFISIGVQPHIKCEPTLEDYKNGINPVLNKGLDEIRKLV